MLTACAGIGGSPIRTEAASLYLLAFRELLDRSMDDHERDLSVAQLPHSAEAMTSMTELTLIGGKKVAVVSTRVGWALVRVMVRSSASFEGWLEAQNSSDRPSWS